MNSLMISFPLPVSTSPDPGELEEWSALQGWEVQYLPLKRGSFEAEFRSLDCPRTVLQQEQWSTSVQLLGTIRDDVVPIAIPIGSHGIFQGLPFHSGDVIFMKLGSELNLLAQSPTEVLTLYVPKRVLESVAWKLGIENPLDLLSGSPVVDGAPSFRQNFLKGMGELSQIPTGYPSSRKELESRMLVFFWESLRKQNERKGGWGVSAPARIRYVKRAQDFIEENLAQTVRVEDIAAASGISARTLQLCFREYFQLSPLKYLQMRRLSCVRKALQKASPVWTTVTQVATAWGFWNLGRFSQEYKHMFGELPSTTLGSQPRPWRRHSHDDH